MLLAADVGGTKTLVGLFEPEGDRPRPRVVREFATLDFDSMSDLVETFLEETGRPAIEAACAGIAGPVTGSVARLTNAPWVVDAAAVAERLGDCPVRLCNDLEATAFAVPVLEPDELLTLQEGVASPDGNAALIAAGTGLGEALLHNINGRFVPAASEGGHADFAARTPREVALLQELARTYGRVEVEQVVSGRGLVNVFRFTHGADDLVTACPVLGPDVDTADLPAAISDTALQGRCEQCMEALEMFVEAYGAEAGNLALRSVASAGLYVGGGIAPKILPALTNGRFLEALTSKDPMVDLLRTLPVIVILNPAAGLIGAAVAATERV